MNKSNKNILFYSILYLVLIAGVLLLSYDPYKNSSYAYLDGKTTTEETEKKFAKPESVRGLYLTASSANNDEYRKNIIAAMKDSRINSVVIDIKDYSGYILYDSQVPEVQKIKAAKVVMKDLKKIIADFHQANIYTIARQTVFQDPVLAPARPDTAMKTLAGNIWYDNKGLAWVDPKNKDVWSYNLAIAQEAVDIGFDEINFDYMRYPSDGNMANMRYGLPENKSKADVMKDFYKFLSDNLSDQTYISIDTFGLVMDHADDDYDLNIGQRLTDAADYFDYVCPMMYPSHYPLTYLGYTNSAEHPGPVVAHGLKISEPYLEGKRAKIRPWLQAFNLRAIYTSTMIDAQIDAVENATTTEGWLLWNARNYYPDYIF
ncbi:hypothetical protein C4566_02485 [Candidatus Parcubacteria bacterium]|nr:MAG: hypothetical protein C4566_02485 [Candidatus Parcubacteria bacterium]